MWNRLKPWLERGAESRQGESALAEIAGTAVRNGPDLAENLPLPLRCPDRGGGTRAVDGGAGNKPAVDKIER